MNPTPLFFNRKKIRLNKKIKTSLSNLDYQRTKTEEILKTRQEKFEINYIPLCSDEDWEAMSDLYARNTKK